MLCVCALASSRLATTRYRCVQHLAADGPSIPTVHATEFNMKMLVTGNWSSAEQNLQRIHHLFILPSEELIRWFLLEIRYVKRISVFSGYDIVSCATDFP